ncbi:tetratricopeptide repeat protein [Anaerolineae bacterium CFX7]|nr:tetratricopeptide repeat protein [Anaerolineae bacterium CFX7]
MARALKLTALGHASVIFGDENIGCKLPAKALALLIYLAVTARPHSREHLANLLWGEESETKAQASLRQALSKLKPIADEYLISEKATVAFDTSKTYWLDVERLEIGDWRLQSPISSLQSLVSLYPGDFLQTLSLKNAPEFEVWVLEQREKYRARAAEWFARIVQENLDAGNARDALAALNRLIALDAWNENAHQQKMRVLARMGKTKDALAQYQTLKKTLRDDLDIEPSPETTALFEKIRDARSLAATPPAALTPFIGRAHARAELARWLAQPATRLVTLFGPGGVGKTRLALTLAQDLRERFLHGSAYISLQAVNAASNVVPTIGAALHFSFSRATDAVTQLGNFLQDKELLLVLDNFEQLTDAANDLARLLQLAPEIKILVTSRARLALQAERVYEVRGLEYANVTGFQNLSRLEGDAPQLFAERAQRVSPAFAWNENNALAVTRICGAVEGLPLALELAAGLTRGATLETIAAQLERDVTALDSDLRDVSERHRSVRAVFEQSWNALNARERAALQKLSVLRGGFDANAAREIADADAATLSALADKALLYRATETRFDLHALVREFAREKLARAQGEAETRARHAQFFGEFVAARASRIIGGTQAQTLAEMRVELENARLAWQWFVAQRDAEKLNRCAPALYRFHKAQSLFQQAETLLAPAAAFSYVAQARLGATFYFLNKLDDARRELAAAFARAQQADDKSESAFCLLQIGNVAFDAGDFALAAQNFEMCLGHAQAVKDYYLLTDAYNNLAFTAARRGDLAQARVLCEHSIDAATRLDEKRGIAGARMNLALIEYSEGKFDAAREQLELALPCFHAVNDQRGVNMTLANLGELAREQNDLARAEELYRRALKGYQDIGQPEKIAQQFRNLGEVAMRRGAYVEAQQLFRDALAVCERGGMRYWEAFTHLGLGKVALKLTDLPRGKGI